MFRHHPFARFGAMLLVLALVSNSVLPVAHAQSTTPLYLPIITNGSAAPQTDLVFRTHITVQTPAQWRDLQRMEVVILEQGADWALVLVDDLQLEDLARLRYNPDVTNALATIAAHDSTLQAAVANLLQQAAVLGKQIQAAEVQDSDATLTAARAELRTYLQTLEATQLEAISQAASVDTDNDGLTDDREFFWCTSTTNSDSDFDGVNDGQEVARLKAWLNNERATPPSDTGQPFLGWPDGPNDADCPDNDRDSVPNLAERWELGLNMQAESTDRDQFDDGQELFGTTNCPGSGTACGYGSLPPANTVGIVLFPEMPGWVRAPGNHPFVAGLPLIKIDVDETSFKVRTVTEVTTDHVISSGTEKSYSTAKTNGTSTSVENTMTWNNWQETSRTIADPQLLASELDPQFHGVTASELQGNYFGLKVTGATLGLAGAVGGALCIATAGIGCAVLAGAGVIGAGIALTAELLDQMDDLQSQAKANRCDPNAPYVLPKCVEQFMPKTTDPKVIAEKQTQTAKSQDLAKAGAGTQYSAYSQSNQILVQPAVQISYPPQRPTTTKAVGRSEGGSYSTTHTQYQEHTVTNGEAFSTSESWGNATAINSIHAADLRFSYTLRNIGTDFARRICEISFNIYIGDDPNPAITYDIASDLGGDGCLSNIQPNLIGGITRTSQALPLTLDQMRTIDLGGPVRIVVNRYVLSSEDFYSSDAASKGIIFAVEDGVEDGDEVIDTYIIPTWSQENVLNVLTRYFPHEIDDKGTPTNLNDDSLIAIWTPEYNYSNNPPPAWCRQAWRPIDYPTKALWCKHMLSTADWWNVYTDGLGNSSEGFQNTQAIPGSVALFRFNRDSDLDGFSDRSETQLGTDLNDATSFPHPEVLAGIHNLRGGNRVTSTLSLLNSGIYDAYGVEAVMIAPDDSVSITNNTVGGSGRVRALKQVIVGSSLKLQTPLPALWSQANHATPGVGGYYTGAQDRTYTFTVTDCPAGGCAVGSGTWTLDWVDGQGGSGKLAFGANYQSPTFLPVGTLGLTLALYSGDVADGDESFTVNARTPRDTFQYTINREPYTEPLVIVSYNDPQGNHRFVLPSQAMSLTTPTANLQQFAGTMLDDVGVEIVTSRPFTVGVNSATLLVNNPSAKTLQNARLFLEVINISGTVVSEVPTQVNLPPGPTAVPVSFNTGSFNPTYRATDDYIVMAFLTDYQGNILDTAGRPLSSFQVDPLPELAADDVTLSWNIGTVTQGTLLKHALALANTGFGRLYTYIPPTSGLALQTVGSRTVGAADQPLYELTLRTADLPVGPYDQTITLATSDPAQPTRSLRVYGAITAANGDTNGGVLQRPLDFAVTVPGSHSQGEWIEFTHNLGPDPQKLHPVKVYSQDYGKVWGNGKYSTSFGSFMESITVGLVGHWNFDNGAAFDTSGNNNNGTIVGATAIGGVKNGALNFDGNDFVRIPKSATLNNLPQATIAYWVKYFKPTSGSNDVSTTLANGPDGVAELGFFTYALHDGIIHYLGQWGNGIPAFVPFDATQPLNQQDFMFVTVVVTDSQIRAYKNGQLQQEVARNSVPIARPSQDWYLGQSGSTDFPYFLTGIMDEVRIYNRALSGEEVSALYRMIKYPFITEQVETAPHTNTRLNLPEASSNGRTYNVQFGHKLDFNASGEQVTTLRVPAGLVANSTMDLLVNNAGTGNLTLKLDIGNNGSWDWESTQNVTNAATFSSPDLSAAFNQYWSSHGSPTTGNVGIPVKLWLSKGATAFITNLQQLNLTATGTSAAFDPKPLDVNVVVTGSHTAGEWVQFTHNLGLEPQSLHPIKIYNQTYQTLWGVGKYAIGSIPTGTSLPWWNTDYRYRRPLSVQARDAIITPYTAKGSFNLRSLTGIRADLNDVRVVYWNGSSWIELDRSILADDLWLFPINTTITANQTNNNFWLYYGNPTANNPPTDLTKIYVPRYSSGVTSWYRFAECGGSPDDTGPDNNDLNTGANGTYVRGKFGCAYQGNGSNQYALKGAGDINKWHNVWVVEFWATKTKHGGDGGNQNIAVAKWGSWGNIDSFAVGTRDYDNSSRVWIKTDNSREYIWNVGLPATWNEPHHLAYVFRRDVGGFQFFWDGQLLIDAPSGIYQPTNTQAWTSLLTKGTGGWSGRDDHWGGTLEQVIISNVYRGSFPHAMIKQDPVVNVGAEQPVWITEQIETAPYNTARLNLPETFTDGRTYKVQFGRKLDFAAAGNQITTLRVPAGLYNSVQLDALVSGLPANATLSLDVGNNGSTEWSGAVANNSTNPSADLAAAFTAYWRSQNSPSGGTLDVPIKVTTTQPGQILLTNLQVSATGSRLRYVRVPVANYTRFLLDFTAGNGGTVALDLGDDGTIDWSTPLAAPRQLTENLNDKLNAYLAGKSGNVDVPVRFYLAPLHPITLNDYQATVASTLDLIANSITVGNGVVTAAGADSILIDADSTATVQATLRNNSSSASGPVTAAFFATATGWGDWYIGSAFVANIAATSNVTVTIPWNTTGFSGTVPVKVVINPYQRVAETNYNNNRKETSVIVPLPPVLPAPPTNLVATMAATNRINLTWADASSNESGFKIERSPDGINGWTQIATVNAGVTTYASTGLACGKAYFYRVRAYNGNGDSAFSNVATALTRLCPPALQPLTGITQTQLTLVWSDNNSNEGGFKIERSATGATPWSQIATVGANVTTYINSGLQCGTPYYYRVRAYNGSNNSAYSAIVNATTTICAPAAPTLLAATAISATQINLSWTDASSNESGFKVERSPDGVNGWTLRTTVGANVTSLADSGLACATTYHYRVRATNAGGDSAASNVANATTPACLPDLIFADSFESGNLLAWSSRAIGGGDLRVNGAAKLVGNWGMEANINDAIAMFVTDDRPNAETRYRARFYFDPNSITMTSGDAHFIFYGFHNTAVVLRVEFRRLNSSYQVRVATLNDAPTTGAATWRTTSYVTISDAPHSLEIDWQAATAPGANNGALSFWIDGGQRPGLTSIDNDTRRIDRVRLGSIAGIDVGTRGAYYFDAFESRRRSYIGPVAGSALAAEVIAPAEPLTTTTGSSVATANLSAETATTLTADVGGLGATVTFPASASQEALIAQLILTDTQTAPDGYALLGEMMAVQSSAPVTQPVTVSVHYGLMAATVTPTATLTLQRWNGDASQWEVLPAQVNAEAQTVTAAINGPAIFALWQQEIEQTGKESSEQMEGGGYFLYLPLVEE